MSYTRRRRRPMAVLAGHFYIADIGFMDVH